MNQALLDYFRCPESYADIALRGDLCPGEGYFLFGPELLCYGQSSLGYYADTPAKATCDLMYHLRVEGSTCLIPFNPSAVVENLRRERYVSNTFNHPGKGRSRTNREFVHYAYYRARPYLGFSLRKQLKRLWLIGWKTKTFPKWPVDRTVDQILEKLLVLCMKARGVERIPFIWFWPEGKKSCVILTHDVEDTAGMDFCGKVMDLDDSYGLKASFQLVPEKRYSVSSAFVSRIREQGFEINLHDFDHDGHLYDEREEFLRRASRINKHAREWGAVGFRSGALYRNLEWYNAYEFSYDMSVPNVAHLDPQPGGCCTIMPYFIGNVLEMPLTTTQDYMLFHLLSDYSIDLWKRQVELITENHGFASFNIHPDYILDKRGQDTYQALLAHLSQFRSEGEVWMPLPWEVDRWWRDRSQMKIVGEPARWRIEGPGKERARLAYARLEGDRLSYSLVPSVEDTPSAPATRAA